LELLHVPLVDPLFIQSLLQVAATQVVVQEYPSECPQEATLPLHFPFTQVHVVGVGVGVFGTLVGVFGTLVGVFGTLVGAVVGPLQFWLQI
jgi:hypothetical protein